MRTRREALHSRTLGGLGWKPCIPRIWVLGTLRESGFKIAFSVLMGSSGSYKSLALFPGAPSIYVYAYIYIHIHISMCTYVYMYTHFCFYVYIYKTYFGVWIVLRSRALMHVVFE